MERIRIELIHWNGVAGIISGRLSVCWLKPTRRQSSHYYRFKRSLKDGNPQVFYHTGCYLNREHEIHDRIKQGNYS